MTKDVLSEEATTYTGTAAEVPGAGDPITSGKGIYKAIHFSQLEEFTSAGWRPVRVIETDEIVADREDIAAPPGSPANYGNNNLAYAQDVASGRVLQLQGSSDPRVISLVKTTRVRSVVFVLHYDEHSVIARLNKQLLSEKNRQSDESNRRATAEVHYKAEQDKTTALKKELDDVKDRLRSRTGSYEEQVTRNRAMEQDMGTLRSDYKKLAAALGDLKVKEILGR
jgi:gas vesicle protein